MKTPHLLIVIAVLSLFGCATPQQLQQKAEFDQVQRNFKLCKSGLEIQRNPREILEFLTPNADTIDFVMMANTNFPTSDEVDAFTPVMKSRLDCNRKYISQLGRITGIKSSDPTLRNFQKSNLEFERNVANLMARRISYGEYFARTAEIYGAAIDRQIKFSQAREREIQQINAQRMATYQRAVQGIADSFNNAPCIACGLSDQHNGVLPNYSAPTPSYTNPDSRTDWDWDWDYQPANGQWVCRGIQTGRYASPDRCAMDLKDDNRWPG